MVTLPFVLLLLDFWPLNRFSDRSARLRLIAEKIPLLAISVIACAVTVTARAAATTSRRNERFAPHSMPERRCRVSDIPGEDIRSLSLVVFYPHPGTRALALVVAAVLLTAVCVAAIALIRRRPYVLVGWAWYLGTLAPMIGIVQVGRQQMADRYTYFSLLGIFLALSCWLAADLVRGGVRIQHMLAGAAVTVLILCATATFVQAGYWPR